jgi:hypothetical protein
MLSPLVT